MLECSLLRSVEDYNLLMVGKESLLAERNKLHYRTEDLEAEPAKARADAVENIAALEAKLKSVEAHSVDFVADGEKRLQDFEREPVEDLKKLQRCMRAVQSIGGLWSPLHTTFAGSLLS
jgi:hypothetical protein